MTLCVALIGQDGIVAATDSRATFGDIRGTTAQNDTMQKLWAVAPHAVVTASGSGELAGQLLALVQGHLDAAPMDGATLIMNLVRDTARTSYGEWFPSWHIQATQGNAHPIRPDLLMLVAGYDVDATGAFTIPRIYQLVSPYDFAPMLTATGFGLQGVPQYALYLLNRLYVPNASVADLRSLATYVITETASQDGKVGGPVQMALVRPDDSGCTILERNEVEAIIHGNEARSTQLRQSFFANAAGTAGASDRDRPRRAPAAGS